MLSYVIIISIDNRNIKTGDYMNIYYREDLLSRIKITLPDVRNLKLKTVNSKEERNKIFSIMKNKLVKLHGKPPKGKWMAWNSCGYTASQGGSKEICTNLDHWFLIDNSNMNEKAQFRQLKVDGHIRNLTTAHQRYLDASTRGNHNTVRKIKCKFCNTSVSQNNITQHEKKCHKHKVYQRFVKDIDNFTSADNKNFNKILSEALNDYLGKKFQKTLASKLTKDFVNAINSKMSIDDAAVEELKSDVELLQTSIRNKVEHTNNLLERYKNAQGRIRQLEEKLSDEIVNNENIKLQYQEITSRKESLEEYVANIVSSYKEIVMGNKNG